MGCGESAVMDLEPIEERANEFATWIGKFDSAHRIPAAFASAADVPALIAEVKRLHYEATCSRGFPQAFCIDCDQAWPCATRRALANYLDLTDPDLTAARIAALPKETDR